jgi:hypothetical protein
MVVDPTVMHQVGKLAGLRPGEHRLVTPPSPGLVVGGRVDHG